MQVNIHIRDTHFEVSNSDFEVGINGYYRDVLAKNATTECTYVPHLQYLQHADSSDFRQNPCPALSTGLFFGHKRHGNVLQSLRLFLRVVERVEA